MGDEHALDDALLTGVLDELRSWGEGPAPVPNAALACLLAAHDIRTAAAPLGPVPQARRKRMLATKLAALGVAAKAALGVGVAVAAVTTAGATGVLPDAVQHRVSKAVETVTPLQLPDPRVSTTATVVRGHEADDDNDHDATTGAGAGGVTETTAHPENHGGCVSRVAKDDNLTGEEHGKAVSAIAQSDCGKEKKHEESSTTTTEVRSTTTSRPSTTVAGGTRGNENSGKGTGNSNENSGKGTGNSNENSGKGTGNSNENSGPSTTTRR